MNDSTSYNGWTNYETWCVNLWLSNDEGLYNWVGQLLSEVLADHDEDSHLSPEYEAADALKDFVEDLPEVASVRENASFVSDLLGAALSEVNWHEIAGSWVADMYETQS